jgi:chromosome partitioning protein
MLNYLVTNPKGGSGKTTLATNLAGYFAQQGRTVLLNDLDRQASSLDWLTRRSENLPEILGATKKSKKNISPAIQVIDSPAGLKGEKLSDAVKAADFVIVPMASSIFDIHATQDFLEVLKEEKTVRKERTFVAMVGMRVAVNTKAAEKLADYLAESEFPVLAYISNAQIYPQVAESGKSIFDLSAAKGQKYWEQWEALLVWAQPDDRK